MGEFMLALKFIVLIVINLIGLGFSVNMTAVGLSDDNRLFTVLGICCIVLNSLCIIVNLIGFLASLAEINVYNI